MKRIKLTIDIAMTVLMPLLMSYSLIGETLHEVIGTAMLALCVAHHILNRKWFGALLDGRYPPRRIFQTALDLLLLLDLFTLGFTGIVISKHLFTFLPEIQVSAAARSLHLLCACWGLVMMSVHAGTHFLPLVTKLKGKKSSFILACAIAAAVSAYGIYAFVARGFPGYMSGKVKFMFFDFDEPLVFYILDQLAIMLLFMTVGAVIIYLLSALSRKERKNGRGEIRPDGRK